MTDQWYTPPTPDEADQFLTGGGVPSAFGKDDPVGTQVTGTITEKPTVKQQTDLETGKPMTWDNGDPRMQLVVTLQVDGIPVTDEDDGRRRIYVKGSKTPGSRSMHDAVASAVRAANVKGLEAGGRLTVQYAGNEPSKTRGFNDRKLWAAAYAPPPPGHESGSFLGTSASPQAPAPPTAPSGWAAAPSNQQGPPPGFAAPPAPQAPAAPPAPAAPQAPPQWTPPPTTPAPAPVAPSAPVAPAPATYAPEPTPQPAAPQMSQEELAAYEAWKAQQG